MSDRERSRSRSPEPRTAQSDHYDENGNDPKADRHDNGGGDGGDNPDEVKLYIGNLDYGTYRTFYLARMRTFNTLKSHDPI